VTSRIDFINGIFFIGLKTLYINYYTVYEGESWTIKAGDINRIQSVEMRYLKTALDQTLENRVFNGHGDPLR
jgi:hypothetical protein